MSIIRIGAINSAVETTDARAFCYLLNEVEEFLVVNQKQQGARGGVFQQAEFFVGVDTFVDLFVEVAVVDLSLNQMEQRGFYQLRQAEIVSAFELTAQLLQTSARSAKDRSLFCQLYDGLRGLGHKATH